MCLHLTPPLWLTRGAISLGGFGGFSVLYTVTGAQGGARLGGPGFSLELCFVGPGKASQVGLRETPVTRVPQGLRLSECLFLS